MNVSEQNNLTYTGHVKIYLEQYGKKKLIAEQHNESKLELLSFIAYCLAGQWANIKYLAPGRIELLEPGTPENKVLGGFDGGTLYSSAPTVKDNSVTFHFRIPSLYFTSSHTLIGARLKNIAGNIELAKMNLDSEVELPVQQTNLTIVVDWTMTIEDKN